MLAADSSSHTACSMPTNEELNFTAFGLHLEHRFAIAFVIRNSLLIAVRRSSLCHQMLSSSELKHITHWHSSTYLLITVRFWHRAAKLKTLSARFPQTDWHSEELNQTHVTGLTDRSRLLKNRTQKQNRQMHSVKNLLFSIFSTETGKWLKLYAQVLMRRGANSRSNNESAWIDCRSQYYMQDKKLQQQNKCNGSRMS